MRDGQAQLRVLGGVELCGPDGRPVRSVMAQPKRLALLIYLAAAGPDAFRRRDTLLALFWPEAGGVRARKALNRAVYFLRQAIGRDVVVTRGDDEIGVSTARLACDAVRFEAALASGAAEQALELYRGDLAPGFLLSDTPGFERWLEEERARLRRRAVEAAMRLAEQEAETGRLGPAERWAHRATVLSPYDERAASLRISLLDRMGDRAGAVRAFEELQRRLREDLEVEPSPETRAQSDAVRSRRESKQPVLSPEASTPQRAEPIALGRVGVTGRPRRVVFAAGLASVVLLGLLAYRLFPGRTIVLTTTKATPVSSDPGVEFQPAISPDGKEVAFVARGGIAVSRAVAVGGGGEFHPIEGVAGTQRYPSWSPDGESLRFWSCDSSCSWNEVGRLGGAVHRLDVPFQTHRTAWSRDGTRAAYVGGDSIFLYSVGDHTTRLLLVHPNAGGIHSLAWSPDGRRIAYVSENAFWPDIINIGPSRIWIVDDDGKRVAVAGGGLNVSPAWLDDRHLLFVSDREGQREIYAVEVGGNGPKGEPQKVPGGSDAHSVSISADGSRLAFAKYTTHQHVWAYPIGGPRPVSIKAGQPVTFGAQVVEAHDVSRDGQWLAYDSNLGAGSGGRAQIFKVRLGTRTPTLVTRDGSGPQWSPDGREIAFLNGGTWVVSADGTGATQLTRPPSGRYDNFAFWSPDGLRLAFWSNRSGRLEVWVLTRAQIGAPWSEPAQLTNFGCSFAAWAPDGSGILCRSEPDETALVLVSLSGTVRWRRELSATGSKVGMPVYSPDGSTLYMEKPDGTGNGIWSRPVAGGAPRLVVTYDDPSLKALTWPGAMNVSRDRLYVTVTQSESDIWVMDLQR
jgi:Tol biopolymer transport system component/DNA-binding SARP family transcriptional activator